MRNAEGLLYMGEVKIGTKRRVRQGVDGVPRIQQNRSEPVDEFNPIGELCDIGPSLLNANIAGGDYRDAFLSLFERSGIGLAVLDSTLRVRSVNTALSARCGQRPEEMCGRDFAEFLHPSVRQHALIQFGRLLRTQEACPGNRTIATCFYRTEVYGRLTTFPVRDAAGQVKMIMIQFTPEEPGDTDQRSLVGARWKLAPLSAKVLEGVAAGDPSVRLAAKLFLSSQGIEYHVGILLRQFKVPNRTALAAKAYSMGVFSIGCWPPRLLPDFIRSGPEDADRAGAEARMEPRRP